VPVPVRDLVSECLGAPVDGSQSALAPSPVKLEIDSAADARVAVVPRRAVGQVLRGLLDNARDASPPGTAVALRVRATDGPSGQVTFEFVDRGPGISAEVLRRVGEPFFTTKPPGKGMGLGVFLARAVVERLGGQLAIRSSPGAGTTATVSLPLGGVS
jgi:two-component system sensor histidine kinase RegB